MDQLRDQQISLAELRQLSVAELFQRLETGADGLTSEEAVLRLERYGYNEIVERRTHPLHRFLSFFWGPIPWMIDAASLTFTP